MNTPRTIKSALASGYEFKAVSNYGGKTERVDLQPRYYNSGMKAILSFWVSRSFARKINPNPILNSFSYPH